MQIGKISWLLMRNYILLRTKVVLCFQSKSRQQKIRAVWICRMSVVFCVAFLCASKTSIAPEHQLSLADSLMHFLHYQELNAQCHDSRFAIVAVSETLTPHIMPSSNMSFQKLKSFKKATFFFLYIFPVRGCRNEAYFLTKKSYQGKVAVWLTFKFHSKVALKAYCSALDLKPIKYNAKSV